MGSSLGDSLTFLGLEQAKGREAYMRCMYTDGLVRANDAHGTE